MPEKSVVAQLATNIGSFRCDESNIKRHLSTDLFSAIFDEIRDDLDIKDLITTSSDNVYFNNAAFGNSYSDVRKLSVMLREFSEGHPDVFYDQVCLPLLNYTYRIAEKFFGTEKVLLVPNCTFGMKSVADYLINRKKVSSFAFLLPIYGATQKLLEYYRSTNAIKSVLSISPGEDALLVEDPLTIMQSLKSAYEEKSFTVLFCDETASQSGRILPLDIVSEFCQTNNIVLVVDGTQSCSLFFNERKQVLESVDYFVMSTHKWVGNVKTCGIIRYKEEAPSPPAISFGWKNSNNPTKSQAIETVRAEFMWQGMMDSYVSYICLSKALKIFSRYGAKQMATASKLLKEELSQRLHVAPLLPVSTDRVINVFMLENSELEPLKDVTTIQNTLQQYGVHISVKKFGQSCSGISVDSRDLNGFNLNVNHRGKDNEYASVARNGVDINGTAHQINGLPDNNSHNKDKDHQIEENVCLLPNRTFYVRISCWSFNTKEDFEALGLVLHNNLKLSTVTNEGLRQQFLFVYELYNKLFSTLTTEALFIRAERLRHPLVFYYCHTAVFYVNKLIVSGFLKQSDRINPRMESIFSVGVDEMSWDDMLEDNYDWSGMNSGDREKYLNSLHEYRELLRDLVLKLIDENPVENPITPDSLHWIIVMGIEHEKVHLETSAVIISQVPVNLIRKEHNFNIPTYWNENPDTLNTTLQNLNTVPTNQLVTIPGGAIFMGKDNLEKDIYGWDNEYGRESKILKGFETCQMLVSNAEYLDFVQAGGYSVNGEKWWSPEGWRFVQDLKVSGPRFWIDQTHYRSLLEEIPMPWDFPVEVNNLEAEAFCNWKGEKLGRKVRLVSHEESFHMRQIAENETSNTNLNKYASPTPVNLYYGNIDGNKVYDISGNVWRHSVSVLTVMEGFKPHPSYNDFTLPTIDGHHNHVLGGSWISLGNCANLNARYGFRRHFYQYAGIRYVCSENEYISSVPKMFTEVAVTKHITENYSDFTADTLVEKKPIKNWPRCFGEKSIPFIKQESEDGNRPIKLMVAHGGTGRTTLEIIMQCKNLSIDHTDMTANTLQVLERLMDDSKLQWYQQVEGTLTEAMEYRLKPSENKETLLKGKGNSVNYFQGDYTNLRPQLNNYDIIVADCRYKDAADELMHMTSRLKAGGVLILGSIDDVNLDVQYGEKHSLTVLRSYYVPIGDGNGQEYPHIYCETRNKHQYAISYFSAWRKQSELTPGVGEQVKGREDYASLTTEEYYEDKSILTSYTRFHFGAGFLGVKCFPLRMAEVCIEACKKYNTEMKTALDAGCGPGRSAIEFCATFEKVEGFDYSQSFVDMMLKEKENRNIVNLFAYQGDGHKQKDICQNKEFDLILGCNLIDRLHSPEEWVLQSKTMLTARGLLIISSPYTWKPEHTDPTKYIGGFKRDGEDFYTVDGLRKLLEPELLLLDEIKVPFVIPDADGTYQYTYSNCTVFGAPR